MLLAIDCGNTNSIFAFFKNSKIVCQFRIETKMINSNLNILDIKLSETKLSPEKIKDIIISSVTPSKDPFLLDICKKYFNQIPIFVGKNKLDLNIKINIKKPEQIGSDRIVNAISASHFYRLPLIVVDFGTATTFDLILPTNKKNIKGIYQGGIIAPGALQSLKSLTNSAEMLPKLNFEDIKNKNFIPVIGEDTVTAMNSGIYWGYVSLVNGLIKFISDDVGKLNDIIFTGGVSSVFYDFFKDKSIFDPNLTVKGLRIIYNMNKI